MMEIERKFRVDGKKFVEMAEPQSVLIRQGYLSEEPTVRVRTQGRSFGGKFSISNATTIDHAWLTVKGKGLLARPEFEYDIPITDAMELLRLCKIELCKWRHTVQHGWSAWVVDQFLGHHEGLWLAEIELKTEDQPFKQPPWLGAEVTSDRRFQNVHLAKHPERFWEGLPV